MSHYVYVYVIVSFSDSGRLWRQSHAESTRRRAEEAANSPSRATHSRERRAAEEKRRRREDAENVERARRTAPGPRFLSRFFSIILPILLA